MNSRATTRKPSKTSDMQTGKRKKSEKGLKSSNPLCAESRRVGGRVEEKPAIPAEQAELFQLATVPQEVG